jgi:hypothetical protein
MTYQFEIGKTYKTQFGKDVLVLSRNESIPGYETVLGDDGLHRYDRSTDSKDAGRVTGTDHDGSFPCNFVRDTSGVTEGGDAPAA